MEHIDTLRNECLVAPRDVPKGEVVMTVTPMMLVPDEDDVYSFVRRRQNQIPRCMVCGKLEETTNILDWVKNYSEELLLLKKEVKAHQSDRYCYCSKACQKKMSSFGIFDDLMNDQEFSSVNEADVWSPLREHLARRCDPMNRAEHYATTLIFCGSFAGDRQCSEILSGLCKNKLSVTLASCDEHDDELIDGTWALLLQTLSSLPDDTDASNETIEYLKNPRSYYTVYRSLTSTQMPSSSFAYGFGHRISMPGTLQVFGRDQLLKMNTMEMEQSLRCFESIAHIIFEQDGQKNDALKYRNKSLRKKLLLWHEKFNNSSTLAEVFNHRIAARVNQAAYEDTSDSPFQSLKYRFFAVCPDLILRHSCIPNCAIVADTDIKAYPNRITLNVIALQDLISGEDLSASNVDLSLNCDMRRNQLKSKFGRKFECSCFRCTVESGDGDLQGISIMEGIRLGDLAMQQSRYRDAMRFYDRSFELDGKNAEVMHARCASRLAEGDYLSAQKMWKEAFTYFPEHNGIRLQSVKKMAYDLFRIKKSLKLPGINVLAQKTKEIIELECYFTENVLKDSECQLAIQLAEEAIIERDGKWTTSRHYAVPTTDLPIHEIPELLLLFNDIMRTRLCPLLAHCFGSDRLGEYGQLIGVHDAFLVKYDSNCRRHLPVHRDESTFSFTIALSKKDEYNGGGTYICDIGSSISSERGSVLSFRGDKLLHGGDPISHGIRYVIVAFCYSLTEKGDFRNSLNSKKRDKFNEMILSNKRAKSSDECQKLIGEYENKTKSDSFSFGFAL